MLLHQRNKKAVAARTHGSRNTPLWKLEAALSSDPAGRRGTYRRYAVASREALARGMAEVK
jgi:hypothetical protein